MMGCLGILIGALLFLGLGFGVAVPVDPPPVSALPTVELIEPMMAEEPPLMQFLVGDIAFPMGLGSYCWTTENSGVCADVMPPTYTSDQHVLVIGDTLELLLTDPVPDTISVSLYPGHSLNGQESIMANAVTDANGRITVTIPSGLDGDYVLAVFVTWSEHGDAFYTTPVRFGS